MRIDIGASWRRERAQRAIATRIVADQERAAIEILFWFACVGGMQTGARGGFAAQPAHDRGACVSRRKVV
jgi:hypothetical protein